MIRRVRRTNPYRRWLVWRKAGELASQVYTVTKRFPLEERSSLIAKMRRASLSISRNIVAGSAHASKREKRRCYQQARVSLAELGSYLDVSHSRLRYLDRERFQRLAVLRRDVGRLLKALVHFVP